MKNATKKKALALTSPASQVSVVSLQIKPGTKTTLEFIKDKKEYTLKHGNASLFRLSDLPSGIPDARHLTRPATMFATAIQYAWAMLPPSAWPDFPRAIDFAMVVPQDEFGPLLEAVGNALREYAENKANPTKNG